MNNNEKAIEQLKKKLKYSNMFERKTFPPLPHLFFVEVAPTDKGFPLLLDLDPLRNNEIGNIMWGNWQLLREFPSYGCSTQIIILNFIKTIILQKCILIEYFDLNMSFKYGYTTKASQPQMTHPEIKWRLAIKNNGITKIRFSMFNKESWFQDVVQ